jgi:hypothetical protein
VFLEMGIRQGYNMDRLWGYGDLHNAQPKKHLHSGIPIPEFPHFQGSQNHQFLRRMPILATPFLVRIRILGQGSLFFL